MRKELLIAGLILLLLGLAISGVIGSFLMALGILLLLYVFFSRESTKEAEPRYVEPNYHKEPARQSEREKPKDYEKPKEYEKPKPRYRNADRAERELRAWGSDNHAKKCSNCGSTSNPPNARFCADCGEEL